MSLSASLGAAVAGLEQTTRRAEVVARNVANSDRAGYARRNIEAGGAGDGTPGSGASVARSIDARLVSLRRESEAQLAGDGVLESFHSRLDAEIGDPDQPGSFQDKLARFDAAIVTASIDPNSELGLNAVVDAAVDLTKALNDLDSTVIAARQQADADIGRAVTQINSDLADIAELNTSIRRLNSGGHDFANLLDQRGLLIDRVSKQIPLRELQRDGGTVALVSTGGLLLVDDGPSSFEFDPRAPITPNMTPPVQLSVLRYNGKEVPVDGPSNGIPGGALERLFELRDEVAPQVTKSLDGLAAELIARFEDPTLDTTRMPGGPGLFTDRGSPLATSPLEGLAGRIAVNISVQADLGGEPWRIRDGLGAVVESSGENPELLLGYSATIAASAVPATSSLPSTAGSVGDHFAVFKSNTSTSRVFFEDRVAFGEARSSELIEQRDGGAVDVDAEMRRLVEIEQSYAANARVVQAISEMMNRLTEL